MTVENWRPRYIMGNSVASCVYADPAHSREDVAAMQARANARRADRYNAALAQVDPGVLSLIHERGWGELLAPVQTDTVRATITALASAETEQGCACFSRPAEAGLGAFMDAIIEGAHPPEELAPLRALAPALQMLYANPTERSRLARFLRRVGATDGLIKNRAAL